LILRKHAALSNQPNHNCVGLFGLRASIRPSVVVFALKILAFEKEKECYRAECWLLNAHCCNVCQDKRLVSELAGTPITPACYRPRFLFSISPDDRPAKQVPNGYRYLNRYSNEQGT
jgi:hypothetical protein